MVSNPYAPPQTDELALDGLHHWQDRTILVRVRLLPTRLWLFAGFELFVDGSLNESFTLWSYNYDLQWQFGHGERMVPCRLRTRGNFNSSLNIVYDLSIDGGPAEARRVKIHGALMNFVVMVVCVIAGLWAAMLWVRD